MNIGWESFRRFPKNIRNAGKFIWENYQNWTSNIVLIFHDFSPRNATAANPPPPPNVHMTFLVDKIDMWRHPKSFYSLIACIALGDTQNWKDESKGKNDR